MCRPRLMHPEVKCIYDLRASLPKGFPRLPMALQLREQTRLIIRCFIVPSSRDKSCTGVVGSTINKVPLSIRRWESRDLSRMVVIPVIAESGLLSVP